MERVRFGSLSTFNAGGLTLLFAYYFKVCNHSVMVGISLADFLSTDFTCPSISGPGQEAEARRKALVPWGFCLHGPWCRGPALLFPTGRLLSFPCRSEAD